MATGTSELPELHPVLGFKLGTTSAGIKSADRPDLVVMEIAEGSSVAALFTTNAFCAAPVTVCKERLARCTPRYLVTNTGMQMRVLASKVYWMPPKPAVP